MDRTHDVHCWRRLPLFTPTEEQKKRAEKFNIHPLIVHILESRGLVEDDAIARYLAPSLADLPNPFSISGMHDAVSCIYDAIKRHEEIVVWGDYDVDGVTATCLLIRFFNQIGVAVRWFVPDRFAEGYGLNAEKIKELRLSIKTESPLLITVDCGISNHREVRAAKELGFRVIVTDHHEPPEQAVPADVILNVKQKECDFKDKNLSGVGTAFYLTVGLRSYLVANGYFGDGIAPPNLKQFLDYVAIGTIADMVPLVGVNRILVRAGLEVLSKPASVWASALLRSCDILSTMVTSDDIAFHLAPKINASGRLEKVDTAMELLLCEDENKAISLANKLTEINVKRKKICRTICDSALNINRNKLIFGDNCIVISGDYHQGVIGIVASQLVNEFNLPAIVFATNGLKDGRKVLKGSGRSVSGINLFEVLSQCEKYFLKFGGHSMAAGLSIYEENLEIFKIRFSEVLSVIKKEKSDRFEIDAEFPLERLFDEKVIDQFHLLEPLGVGNKKPIFSDSSAFVYNSQAVGFHGNHLKVFLRCKYANKKGIGFNLAHRKPHILKNATSHIIYSPMLNRYNNQFSWGIRLHDVL